MRSFIIFLFLLRTVSFSLQAANSATVKEYNQAFTTYPYSDPDPIAKASRFYPYFRYDGFTDTPVKKNWKVVELANDYLQILILPEIGGKVWAAIEKSTGRPFIYYNHVVKFRDVSLRGPWTSGGMEANYGIFGHTPNCFSPVDYATRTNADGSASCIIGALDLLTRSVWRLEINLPPASACFSTRSFWHNGSGEDQPYYTWMNVGIKAANDLQFINPGTHYLGHDGKSFAWPVNPDNGHEISWYEQNNFGLYKSYHIFGRLSEFFGGYYYDDDFGMAHYSSYGDKPGRKIWIWGLSRQGTIWENLLTDSDGQYVEVQSGRLFNQTGDDSTLTPFKHKEFPPYATDTWTEYWEPVKGIKGFVSASPWGAMNVIRDGTRLTVRISPAQAWRDTLEVFDGTKLLSSLQVDLSPMQPVKEVFHLTTNVALLRVCLDGDKLAYAAGDGDVLSRPVKAPDNFDWQTSFGRYLKGRENADEREYVRAASNFEACLHVDANFAPALTAMAALANRRGEPVRARDFALHALSIDTYDGAANYQLGIASVALGHESDAKDAFSIAALSPAWRNAANTELAKVYCRGKEYDRALAGAASALQNDSGNLDAIQIQACIARLKGNMTASEALWRHLLELDPLNHFVRFEMYLCGRATGAEFTSELRNELPQETCLELAAWYRNMGLDDDAARVLELSPPTAETLYWMAYLRQDAQLLARAEKKSPSFVFPFRNEAVPVFEWARQHSPAWQPSYYLALIRWFQGNLSQARKLLTACGDEPSFGPFYAVRAQLMDDDVPRDLEKAEQLDPTQWRYGSMLVEHYLNQNKPSRAGPVASRYALRFPVNNTLAFLDAKTLVLNSNYQAAADRLDSLKLLPSEGSTEAHSIFREAQLMLALECFTAGSAREALQHIAKARQWPENLGVGKPYATDVDERLEDWLSYECYQLQNDLPQAKKALVSLVQASPSEPEAAGEIVEVLALKKTGQTAKVEKILARWRQQDKETPFTTWRSNFIHGGRRALPPTVRDSSCRILAAWMKGPRLEDK